MDRLFPVTFECIFPHIGDAAAFATRGARTTNLVRAIAPAARFRDTEPRPLEAHHERTSPPLDFLPDAIPEWLGDRHQQPLAQGAILRDPDSAGLVGCGIYDMKTPADFGQAIAIARGTPANPLVNPDDLLTAKIVDATPQAKKYGIQIGMTGREAVELMLAAKLE